MPVQQVCHKKLFDSWWGQLAVETTHFVFGLGGEEGGRRFLPAGLKAEIGESEVVCISREISYLLWLYLFCSHGVTVALAFAATVDRCSNL